MLKNIPHSTTNSKDYALSVLPLELRKLIYSYALPCPESHSCFWNHGPLLTLLDGRVYKLPSTPRTQGTKLGKKYGRPPWPPAGDS
jgi:hypothetical protein